MRRILVGLGLGALLAAPASAFSVSFDWNGTNRCDPRSPPFRLASVPAGTARLRFAMTDLNVPNYPHGGGTVAYSNQRQLARGAFRYTGPCPPDGARHQYRWTVEAQDASGRTLGTAIATSEFPPR